MMSKVFTIAFEMGMTLLAINWASDQDPHEDPIGRVLL